MGTRTLMVSAELFVEFLKRHDDSSRTFTIEHPLPDDAVITAVWWISDHEMGIEMESAAWPGVDMRMRPLSPVPTVRINYFAPTQEPPPESP